MADGSKKDLIDSLGEFVPEGAKKFGRNVNALRDVAYKPVLDSFDSIARAIHHITQAPLTPQSTALHCVQFSYVNACVTLTMVCVMVRS